MPTPPRHQGFGVLAVLVMLGMIGVVVAGLIASSRWGGERQENTDRALQLAREALLAYATTYRETHPDQSYGFLPCPDTDNDGIAELSCGAAGLAAIGRLPFRTLNIPDLRDGASECLWYAVAGPYKNSPKLDPHNWDAPGQFKVVDEAARVLLAVDSPEAGAAAVIFAPGPPRPGQARGAAAGTACPGTAAADPAPYLDATYDFATNAEITLTQGTPGGTANNDRLAWITAREVWQALKQRNDAMDLNAFLLDLRTGLERWNALPLPAVLPLPATTGPKKGYRLDSVYAFDPAFIDANVTAGFREFVRAWGNHLFYLRCDPAGQCLTVNGAACAGALAFGGEWSHSRRWRRNPGDTTQPVNFLEGDNHLAVTDAATTMSGASAIQFLPDPRAQKPADVVLCLNPSPTALSFERDMPLLQEFNPNPLRDLIRPDNDRRTVSLGAREVPSGGSSGNSGCVWFDSTPTAGSGVRAFFTFNVQRKDEGFTFVLADAAQNPDTQRCGAGGEFLGYAGQVAGINPIVPPKIGFEFDTRRNGSRNDPDVDHAAILFWGGSALDDDNVHGQPGAGGDPANPAQTFRSDDLDEGTHLVRIEVARTRAADRTDVQITLWVLRSARASDTQRSALRDLARSVTEVAPVLTTSASIPDRSAGVEALRSLRVGFTTGQSGENQEITLADFRLVVLP